MWSGMQSLEATRLWEDAGGGFVQLSISLETQKVAFLESAGHGSKTQLF